MKLVVGYVDTASFEPIREALLELGYGTLSVSQASGALPEPTMTGHFRGAAVESHLRPKVRFECVVGGDHVAPIVDTVLALGGERKFVFVLNIEEAHPLDTVTPGPTAQAVG